MTEDILFRDSLFLPTWCTNSLF